jgi:hypothetical protein
MTGAVAFDVKTKGKNNESTIISPVEWVVNKGRLQPNKSHSPGCISGKRPTR